MVADFVWKLDGNIVHADQHTDSEAGVFFQRVEFTLGHVRVDRRELADRFAGLARECSMDWKLSFSDDVPRVAIFVSKFGHCLYDLLARWRAGQLGCDVVAIVSNWPDHADTARHFGVPYHEFPVTAETRARQERAAFEVLTELRVDVVVLARYMQILGDALIGAFRHKIINIHHSFLPAFKGGRPYAQAHERGVKLIGATAHYATEDLDEGPIIEQGVTAVSHRDSVSDLVLKGRDLETVVLARALRAHLAGRVLVYGHKTVVFD
jgi:formyltetrahydrofolate deformylase